MRQERHPAESRTSGDQQIIRYLLDQMEPREREEFEHRALQDEAGFDLVAAEEDHLIMQYLHGTLERDAFKRFEEIYLSSPARRARIESAKILQQAAEERALQSQIEQPQPAFLPRFWRLILAGCLAIAVIAGILLMPRMRQRPHDNPTQPTLSFALAPGLQRGAAGAEITVPPSISAIEFQLQQPSAAKELHASLGTPEHPGLWSGAVSKDGTAVIVPASVLRPGDYALSIQERGPDSTWNEMQTYYFRVRK